MSLRERIAWWCCLTLLCLVLVAFAVGLDLIDKWVASKIFWAAAP